MEDKTLTTAIKAAALLACTIVLSITGCIAHEDYQMSREIIAGAKPVEVMCAHTSNAHDACLVLSGR